MALDQAIYSSSLCGKTLTITRTSTGKSITVTVADDCPGCRSKYSLDLSTGAYFALGTEAEGIVSLSFFLESRHEFHKLTLFCPSVRYDLALGLVSILLFATAHYAQFCLSSFPSILFTFIYYSVHLFRSIASPSIGGAEQRWSRIHL